MSKPWTGPLKASLGADAKNRALRTFLQGLAIDLAVAVAALVLASTDSITDRAGLVTFGLTLAKTVVQTIAAYVMRRFLDPSSVPTPLPPSNPGTPAEPTISDGNSGITFKDNTITGAPSYPQLDAHTRQHDDLPPAA